MQNQQIPASGASSGNAAGPAPIVGESIQQATYYEQGNGVAPSLSVQYETSTEHQSNIGADIVKELLPSEIVEKVQVSVIKAWFWQPIMFIMRLSTKNQILIVTACLVTWFIVYPFLRYLFNKFCTMCDPVRFSLQHVMIIGGSDGLGKELVREAFMKGALITMIGRDEDQLKAIRDELDTSTEGEPCIRYFRGDIT